MERNKLKNIQQIGVGSFGALLLSIISAVSPVGERNNNIIEFRPVMKIAFAQTKPQKTCKTKTICHCVSGIGSTCNRTACRTETVCTIKK